MKELELTNIQRAYLLGREKNFELGGYSTHVYYEFLTELEPERFERALNEVIRMQPVMRSVINENGTQKIKEKVEYYRLKVLDWSDRTESQLDELLNKKRAELSHRLIPCGTWPPFSFEFAIMPDGKTRLFVDYDLIVSDAISFVVLCSEIKDIYENGRAAAIEGTYTDYLRHLRDMKKSRKYQRDREYWNNNQSRIAPAPQLPYTSANHGEGFARRHFYIDQETWSKGKSYLQKINVTPNVAALAVYACLLGFWSGDKEFTLNLPMTSSIRKQRGMDRIIGDFTESVLITLPQNTGSMEEYLNIVSEAFFCAFKHKNYDGIEIMNDLSRKTGKAAIFPVVFTGMISQDMGFEQFDFLGEMVYGISQTPQVTLDCQVFETNGMLKVVWDYRKSYFEKAEIDGMFDEYIRLISCLGNEKQAPQVPGYQKRILRAYNNSAQKLVKTNLVSFWKEGMAMSPDHIAVKDGKRQYTYRELEQVSGAVAEYLTREGVRKGDRVGIMGERNIQTVAGILGIVRMGGVYVPINPRYPKERQKYILEHSNCVKVIDSNVINRVNPEYGPEHETGISPDDEAYVIYTSGSTGRPKGVVITHDSAVNTIHDVSSRFSVSKEDVLLNVASFGFDLSVYDIFAAAAAGATLYIARDPRDMEDVRKVIKDESVTIWNSVPAVMGLLTDVMEDGEQIDTLRLVLLSGDWIPVDLPEKIKNHFPAARIISMGGATEASIWSVIYPIERDTRSLTSVPYGYPMANQNMYILDENRREVPLETLGEIYIGGRGVAKGYDNDREKTDSAFFNHEEFGRIYRTGDYGRIKREGYMEFCGRRDSQIKMNGHRIELGEIESTLLSAETIEKAVLGKHENELIAYIVTKKQAADKADENLSTRLKKIIEKEKRVWEDTIDFKKMRDHMNRLGDIAIWYMYKFMEDSWKWDSLKDFLEDKKVLAKYTDVVECWITELEREGYIRLENGKVLLENRPDAENRKAVEDLLFQSDFHEAVREIDAYFFECCENLESILAGERNPLEIFYNQADSKIAGSIYDGNRMSSAMNILLGKIAGEIVKKPGSRILELGAGIGSAARKVLENIKDRDYVYVYSDISDFFLEKAKEELGEYTMEYMVLDMNQNLQSQGCRYGEYDMVIVSNTMHDSENIEKTLTCIKEVMKADGVLVILETTENTRAQMVSFGLLEGLAKCEDFRKGSGGPMISSETWLETLEKSGFTSVATAVEKGDFADEAWQNIFVSKKTRREADVAEEELLEHLRNRLPDYMIPSRIYRIEDIPLSANGKVDTGSLPLPAAKQKKRGNIKPATEKEKILKKLWEENLHIEEIGVTDNFFALGGDSLKAIKLATAAKKEGILFDLAQLYDQGTIRGLAQAAAFTCEMDEEKEEEREAVKEEELEAILAAIES